MEDLYSWQGEDEACPFVGPIAGAIEVFRAFDGLVGRVRVDVDGSRFEVQRSGIDGDEVFKFKINVGSGIFHDMDIVDDVWYFATMIDIYAW